MHHRSLFPLAMRLGRFFRCLLAWLVLGLVAATPPATAQTVSTFRLPFADSQPWGITRGNDGNMWFTEAGFGATRVGRIDGSGRITEFFTPSRINQGNVITAPDGVWFVEPAGFPYTLGRITPDGTVTEYGLDLATCGPCSLTPYGITQGPDGHLWFTEWVRNAIVRFERATGAFTYYSIGAFGFGATGITVGADNALWFAINSTNPAIGRLDPATGAISTFVSPLVTDPLEMTLGPDGNVWFTQPRDNSVSRITPLGQITRFVLPTAASSPQRIVVGPDGALWVTLHAVNRVARISTSGVITEPVSVPGGPWGIARGNGNDLWITLRDSNQVGRFTVSGGITETAVLSALAVAPASLVGAAGLAGTANGSVQLSAAAPAGGAVVALSSSAAVATVPASVTVPAGATSAAFAVSSVPVTVPMSATLRATLGSVTRTATFTVNPAAPGGNVSVTVSASGRSGQRITSSPTGINVAVGSSQTASFVAGRVLTLSVSSDRTAVWSGACSSNGSRSRSCSFNPIGNTSVSANVR